MQKQNTKFFLLLSLLLAVGLVALAFYHINVQNKEKLGKELAEEKLVLKTKLIDSLSTLNNHRLSLLDADKYYLVGKYDSALMMYTHLLTETISDTSAIQLRIQRIEEIKSNKDTLYQDYRTLRYALNSVTLKRDSLLLQLDSLTTKFSSQVDDKKDKIQQLEKQIAEQEEQLQRKDKLKVITFKNQQGNTIHYLGEVKNDMANGGGVGIFDTGGMYKGEWKDNMRHGKGVYTWKDGHKYEGEFVEGIRQGQGTYFWSSGEKYVGQWKDGKRNGEGTLFDKDNNISYQGKWADDKIADGK